MTEEIGHTRILATALLGMFFMGIWFMAWARPDILPAHMSTQRIRLVASLVLGIALIIEAIDLSSRAKEMTKKRNYKRLIDEAS